MESDQTDANQEPLTAGHRQRSRHAAEQISLPTDGECGLQPGVDLDRTSELLDRMDEMEAGD